ncbi:MAG: hypothetical protein FWD70_07785, partial [Desulfuromonadales bacterium]|nr:hypothetical protein [Desulfuromonadales bacterium]
PYGDGNTTSKYSRYSPDKPVTSILSRYSSTRTVSWSSYAFDNNSGAAAKYGTNRKATFTKALSAHGNAIKNQFPVFDTRANGYGDDENYGLATPTNLSPNRNVFCYDCHNSHGSDATGITSSYSSATGRYKGGMLKTTVYGQRGYTADYTPQSRTITYTNYSSLGQAAATTTNATFNTGAAICNDCHNTDTSKVNIDKPWSMMATYSSSRAIVGYWSTPYFDNYTVNSAKRSVYKQGGSVNARNDRRKPMGGHFGTSIASRPADSSDPNSINGLCTPCHDPHGVSNALGNSGTATTKAGKDYGVPLLKGTWITSPYREDKAGRVVRRGGGSGSSRGAFNGGAAPGYHIDQNTFMTTPAPTNGGASTSTSSGNRRAQSFRAFSNNSSVYGTNALANYPKWVDTDFAGLCTQCHSRQSLTGSSAATTSAAWKAKQRIHQAVAGWGSTNGTNSGNIIHAYTCSKCHAPHVSRLPRLLVTNCLDARHFGQSVSTTINSVASGTTRPGNIIRSTTSSGSGAGRFPGGGSRYSGASSRAQNPGGWWFRTNGAAGTAQPTAPASAYGPSCHNATNAGGATYNPDNQKWNNRSSW